MPAKETEAGSVDGSGLAAAPGGPATQGTAQGWQILDRKLVFSRKPLLMGIVNVTPDSFSDGGNWLNPAAAIEQGLQLVRDGADLLDIGGESTRPYSQPVPEEEELRRVIPVVAGLAQRTSVPVSIDTSKAAVAEAAIAAGASIINDVTGLQGDPRMPAVALASGAGVCIMHMQGTPGTMQDAPAYGNVVDEVLIWLRNRKASLIRARLDPARICLDPGIGFGKSHEHNRQLIAGIARLHESGSPILVGHSRKGFIGKLTGPEVASRDAGTLGISLHLAQSGVQILRLHEIAATRHALQCFDFVRNAAALHCYEWPRPAASVDLVILRTAGAGDEVLLIRRKGEPFAGSWALPGGFVEPDETVEAAAHRELREETGVANAGLSLLGVWSQPDRDPRSRVISTVFTGRVADSTIAMAADDAEETAWFQVSQLPLLAFDHLEMVRKAQDRLIAD